MSTANERNTGPLRVISSSHIPFTLKMVAFCQPLKKRCANPDIMDFLNRKWVDIQSLRKMTMMIFPIENSHSYPIHVGTTMPETTHLEMVIIPPIKMVKLWTVYCCFANIIPFSYHIHGYNGIPVSLIWWSPEIGVPPNHPF